MEQSLARHGREKHRERHALAEHGRPQVARRDVAQHARHQAEPRECGLVVGERALVLGAAVEVVEDLARERGLRQAAELGDVDRRAARVLLHGVHRPESANFVGGLWASSAIGSAT